MCLDYILLLLLDWLFLGCEPWRWDTTQGDGAVESHPICLHLQSRHLSVWSLAQWRQLLGYALGVDSWRALIATHTREVCFSHSQWTHSHMNFPAFKKQNLIREDQKDPKVQGHYVIPTWVKPCWSRWTETARNSSISSLVSLQIIAPLKWTRPTKQTSQFKINKQTTRTSI